MAIIFTVFLEVNFCKINTINTLQMENTKKGEKYQGLNTGVSEALKTVTAGWARSCP